MSKKVLNFERFVKDSKSVVKENIYLGNSELIDQIKITMKELDVLLNNFVMIEEKLKKQ